MTAPRKFDHDAAVEMWREGASIRDVAQAMGVSDHAAYGVIRNLAPSEYAAWVGERGSWRLLWDREAIVERVQAWVETYGQPPTAQEWNPAMARARGRHDIAERWEQDGCWPTTTTTQYVFGSWSAAIAAAGFTPRAPGQRGPGIPHAVAKVAA